MVTWGKAVIFKPKVFLVDYDTLEPTNVKDSLNNPHWKKAKQE